MNAHDDLPVSSHDAVSSMRAIVRIALFAAIIAALGILPKFDLPLLPGVPVTAQTLGVMLAGIFLGPRNGALAVLLFLFVMALGAPFLSGGRGGLAVFYGPSVGYLAGWVVGAFVCGAIMQRLKVGPAWLRMEWLRAWFAAFIGGLVVVHAFGIVGLAWKANLTLPQAAMLDLAFVPGDILKTIAAAMIAAAVLRSIPSFRLQRPL